MIEDFPLCFSHPSIVRYSLDSLYVLQLHATQFFDKTFAGDRIPFAWH